MKHLASISLFLISTLTVASTPPSLSDRERDQLRYRLEDSFNELDLMVKNQRSETHDLERQRREMEILQVLERIPIQEKMPELRKELTETAHAHGVQITGFERRGVSKPKQIPSRIFSDERFRLEPSATALQIRVAWTAIGSRSDIDKWISSWKTNQVRLVELEELKVLGRKSVRILARTYRFREMEFPKVEIRDPARLLPDWAQKDPKRFAETEPLLWDFVTQAREIAPKAAPLYQVRRELLLLNARMSFFVQKSLAH